jgi:PAS domain S-box-containing protein
MVVLFTRQERAAVERGLRDTTRALSLAVERDLARSVTTLEALATSHALDDAQLTAFGRDVERVLPSQDGWSDIMLFDPSGRELLGVRRGPASASTGQPRDVLREVVATGHPSISDLRPVIDSRRNVVRVYVPVLRDGKIRYVLGASLAPAAIARVLAAQQLPADWTGTIVDRRKVVIARAHGRDGAVGMPTSSALAAHTAAAEEGVFRASVDGVVSYSAFSRLPLSGWTVIISVPVAVVDGPLRPAIGGVLGIGTLLGVVALVLALVLARRVSSAMVTLSEAARAIGRDEPSVAVASSVAEVNEVGRAIQDAGVQLRRRAEERDRGERALNERDERLRLALAAGRMATWDWDVRRNVVSWSENVEALDRGRCDGFDGTIDSVLRFVHPHERALVHEAIRHALKDGGGIDTEFPVRWPSGLERWVAVKGQALLDEGGRARRMLGVAMDVTEQRRAEAEQAQLAAIVEYSEDAIIGKRLDGTITSWNEAAERIFGYTADEAKGHSIRMLFPRDEPDELREVIGRIRRGERVDQLERGRVRKDGRRIEVSLTVSPVKDGAGRVVGASTIARDITAHRRLARRLASLQALTDVALSHPSLDGLLREMLARVCSVLECDVACILLLTEDGRDLVVRASHGVEDEAAVVRLGPGVAGHIAASRRPFVVEDLRTIEADSPALSARGLRSLLGVPLAIKERDIGVLYIATAHHRRFAEDEVQLLGLAADRIALAVDHARLFEAAHAARQEAETANRSKDQFLAVLSHELRTPLQAMLGWVRMLRSGRLDEATAARALATVERSTQAQAQLINDLLDVSRIVAGKLQLDPRAVDLRDVVGHALETVRPLADARRVALGASLPEAPSTLSGDAGRLEQAVWNLLSNAIKFTPEGGRVDVALREVGADAVIDVCDTGKGIAPDVLPRIFERFRQGDTATRVQGGLGLGLAIVRHLVTMHGGTVSAHSDGVGHGATFTIRLPLATATTGDLAPPPVEAVARGATRADFPGLDGLRVLVVDDEADARGLLHTVLSQCGAQVTAVGSAAEALRALGVGEHDVLVSDVSMPEEDGYSLIRKVRTLPDERARIPAAALTAYARAEDRETALAAGFHVHVAKPVEPVELARIVRDLARRTAA